MKRPGFSAIGQYNGRNDAVVRGSTLFFELTTMAGSTITFSLRRYNPSTYSMISGSISLGNAGTSFYSGLPGQAIRPGWDVTADGAHIVYQVVAQSGAGIGGLTVYYVRR